MASRWAQAWIELLDDGSASLARRLAQGGNLLRSGRVTDVRLAPGSVSGRVQGKRATPLAVEIAVEVLTDAQWRRVVDALAGQVRHRARLLAGQVPDGLGSELEAVGVPLLPRRADLHPACGCEDRLAACMHVAAVWLAAAARIAGDPFDLLRVRGRGRERLLAEVAATHGSRGGPPEQRGVDPATLDTAGWLAAREDLADLDVGPVAPPRTVAGPLRLLGDPPGWAGGMGAGDLLAPLVERAGAWAAALSGGEPVPPGRETP